MSEKENSVAQLRFGPKNLIFLGAAAVCLGTGYVMLAAGSMTVAPLLLVLGYCVFFPLGLVL
jgi:hypothetical protein